MSDDPTEEKLDDSNLQWEHTLEFDDEFHLDRTYVAKLGCLERSRNKEFRISVSTCRVLICTVLLSETREKKCYKYLQRMSHKIWYVSYQAKSSFLYFKL